MCLKVHKYRYNFVSSQHQIKIMAANLKIGDKVKFDSEMIETFKEETSNGNPELLKYQEIVIAGINQVGVIKELGEPLTNVSFADGWDIPMPTKYLVVLP